MQARIEFVEEVDGWYSDPDESGWPSAGLPLAHDGHGINDRRPLFVLFRCSPSSPPQHIANVILTAFEAHSQSQPTLLPDMTRGRRKDLTIPPSRALLQQRDYRARKARYVAELEDRCRRAEEENVHLREELEALQARLQAVGGSSGHRSSPSPEVATATSELMHNLSVAQASLARFQKVAFSQESPANNTPYAPMHAHTPISLATPSFTPSPLPQPHRRLPSPRPRIELPPLSALQRDISRAEPPTYYHRPHSSRMVESGSSGYSETECCGGYLDCRGLVEDEEEDPMEEQIEEEDEEETRPLSRLTQRMSDMR
ncbi:hypothetical protein AcW1_009170 [Taiwanofungus camphoratus]|nr:hypothetical protein AcW1_009170 [Antrodia cinnamomea]